MFAIKVLDCLRRLCAIAATLRLRLALPEADVLLRPNCIWQKGPIPARLGPGIRRLVGQDQGFGLWGR